VNKPSRVFNALLLGSRAVLLGVALSYVLIFIVAGYLRAHVALPLDNVELPILQPVHRVVANQPIYTRPTSRYVPLVYPPLYYFVSAAAMRVTGDGYLGPRLVSYASSICAVFLIGWLVRRETRALQAAVIAPCLYVALFGRPGQWLDVGRVDALMVLLVLAAVCIARAATTARAWVCAGILFGLAVMTKQPAFIIAAPFLVWQFAFNRRAALVTVGAFAATLALFSAWMMWTSDGWFFYYTMRVAFSQNLGGLPSLKRFWSSDLLSLMPVATLFPCALSIRAIRDQAGVSSSDAWFYAAGTAGVLLAGMASEVSHDSSANAMLPAYAWFAVLFGISAHHLMAIARRSAERAAEFTLVGLQIAQFAALIYVPADVMPNEWAFLAGNPLVVVSGDPRDPANVTPRMHLSGANRLEYAQRFAVADLLESGPNEVTEAFVRRVRHRLCRATPARPVVADAIVLDPQFEIVPESGSPCRPRVLD
jgi:hypothetical protein